MSHINTHFNQFRYVLGELRKPELLGHVSGLMFNLYFSLPHIWPVTNVKKWILFKYFINSLMMVELIRASLFIACISLYCCSCQKMMLLQDSVVEWLQPGKLTVAPSEWEKNLSWIIRFIHKNQNCSYK